MRIETYIKPKVGCLVGAILLCECHTAASSSNIGEPHVLQDGGAGLASDVEEGDAVRRAIRV